MKGDFSRVRFSPHHNFNGILPQQGKVLLDSDGIAQTLIENNWRETAARDWVGNEACVPSSSAGSFKVSAASLAGGVATLTVGTGHIWADGLLARLESHSGGTTVTRTATWLEPPIVPNAGGASTVAAGTTDAVVLEVWQHAANGFQMPDILIEPALGGPDTAERLQTSFAFRLARLNAGQTCKDLTYDESGRGALTVSLVPPVTTTGDCPVTGSGGYSGFEHQLYRIEIADTSGAASQFKWSRLNGGLVGRGTFDPTKQTIAITANLPAITGVNQTSFYLEIESYDSGLGYSHVIAGAPATLSGSTLQLAATPSFGAYPTASGAVFFRLWDGIEPVSNFPISATPAQLENGILLQFDSDGAGKYFPGDYWMFPVRAQGIPNPQTLINAKKPEGIVYHRVPLAEITWAASGSGNFTAGSIQDCRAIVPPLSQTRACCTCRVGDGVDSFGDFTSIQEAIDSLPAAGGEVCILPGRYFEYVNIVNRRDIVIHGCGWETRVCSPSLSPSAAGTSATGTSSTGSASSTSPINAFTAVISIVGSWHIELRSFAVEAANGEAGILADGTGTSVGQKLAAGGAEAVASRGVIDLTVDDMVLTSSTLPAILAEHVQLLRIERSRIAMQDVASQWPAVYVSGSEIHVEKNWIGIQTGASLRDWLPGTVAADLVSQRRTGLSAVTSSTSVQTAKMSSGSSAPAQTAQSTTGVMAPVSRYFVDYSGLHYSPVTVATHNGGIQVGGPSTDVYIVENEIAGGSFNGITLGSLTVLDPSGNDTGVWKGVIIVDSGCCTGTVVVSGTIPGSATQTVVAGGLLTNIQIHRNRIRDMGMCGIGPVGFFDLTATTEIITIVGLTICQNEISRTLLQNLTPFTGQSSQSMGYGAICLPDVQDLTICDNKVTDFGPQPGADVCGIYVLHGEMIEINRNQILETRDWSNSGAEPTSLGGQRGGIIIVLGTPLSFPQSMDDARWAETAEAPVGTTQGSASAPTYEPGLPAVRIENNVVRVPLNYALGLVGSGPFSITGNQFTCGGLTTTTSFQLAQTVLILNLGFPIDIVSLLTLPSQSYQALQTRTISSPGLRTVSSGTVLFANNVCQLEASASGQTAAASVMIVTLDALIFSNNLCWVDAHNYSALTDAFLMGFTVNAIGNRFEEAIGSVYFSGITVGYMNITGENISTNCLIVLGSKKSDNNNISLFGGLDPKLCTTVWEAVLANLGL